MFNSPPPSPLRQSPRHSRTTSARNSPIPFRSTTVTSNFPVGPDIYDNQEDADSSQDKSSSPYESEFALDDFSIKSVLGSGRTKVYYEAKNQLALKAIDLWKLSYMLSELHNEIVMYHILSDLQGVAIPRLVLHGYWEGDMYCIGFSLCGSVPETLSDFQKQSILTSIDAIHARGIVHNDIKKENILVDENGTVVLIDFGFATQNSCKDALQDERNQLLKCSECL
jgi:serine/threonine protein kinase